MRGTSGSSARASSTRPPLTSSWYGTITALSAMLSSPTDAARSRRSWNRTSACRWGRPRSSGPVPPGPRAGRPMTCRRPRRETECWLEVWLGPGPHSGVRQDRRRGHGAVPRRWWVRGEALDGVEREGDAVADALIGQPELAQRGHERTPGLRTIVRPVESRGQVRPLDVHRPDPLGCARRTPGRAAPRNRSSTRGGRPGRRRLRRHRAGERARTSGSFPASGTGRTRRRAPPGSCRRVGRRCRTPRRDRCRRTIPAPPRRLPRRTR